MLPLSNGTSTTRIALSNRDETQRLLYRQVRQAKVVIEERMCLYDEASKGGPGGAESSSDLNRYNRLPTRAIVSRTIYNRLLNWAVGLWV